MPSPFPGMDPYLEGSLWGTVHFQLSAEIARQLAPRLRPKYLAFTNERFVLTSADPEGVAVTDTTLYPDASVARTEYTDRSKAMEVLEAAPLELATLMPDRVPQITVEIRDTVNRQLVTAIEVLSPTNKRGEGRQEYVARRQRYLLSTAHLMEIDLLRTGQRVPMREPLPAAPYFVLLSRAERRPTTQVWPIRLDAALPKVPVPLLAGDADVALDLQQAFTSIYDLLGYDLAVDYASPSPVPLKGADVAWASERIQAWRVERASPYQT